MSHDLVPEVEVERARNMVADLEQKAVMSRQQWRVQSANLTQVLRLDPRAVVEPLEHDHLQITLIDPGRALEDLMPIALTNRPEIASRQAMVQAATAAIRREKMRPFLPNIALNGFQTPFEMIQAGIFGFGPNNKHEPVDGPRRLQHPARLAVAELRVRQPGDDQAAAGPAVAGHRSSCSGSRTRWRRT